MKMDKKDRELLSTLRGITYLLHSKKIDFDRALRRLRYEQELRKLQVELILMQNWVVENNQRLLVLIEGNEFAGKGGTIKAFSEHLNPRSLRLVALPKPTPQEAGQWYFQRYILQLPQPGEIALFDRSWYNRAVVEPVNGFCTKKQYKQFMNSVNHFEDMLHHDGIMLIKIHLGLAKKTQAERIEIIRKHPLRRWELTKVDERAQKLWDEYQDYTKEMFKQTDTNNNPWIRVDGNDKYRSRLETIRHVLSVVPYTP